MTSVSGRVVYHLRDIKREMSEAWDEVFEEYVQYIKRRCEGTGTNCITCT